MSSTIRLGTCRKEAQYRSTIARPIRRSDRTSGRFSRREMVGCEHSSRSDGARSSAILNRGSRRKAEASLRAISASRAKGSYLKDKFYRLKARRGSMRAALAIAHKILVAAYHMLAKGVGYREIGEAYLDKISQTRTVANLKRRLERLGFHVTLQSKA